MTTFHEHKLWQESYVALMDLHEALETTTGDERDHEVGESLVGAAQDVAATIADGLTRRDKNVARDLMYDAVGLVAVTRTHLAVAWGRGLVDDETFRKIDAKYATLSDELQNFK